jgi:hypothetical protein
MNPKAFSRASGSFRDRNEQNGAFRQFDATELYCPKCKRAVPVRQHLLLVLPEGDKYEYRCAFCSESVGTKIDRQAKPLTILS